MNILIVSDYWSETFQSAKKQIKSRGHRVILADSFYEAKDLITKNTFDYVLTGIGLPYSEEEQCFDFYGSNLSDFVAAYTEAKTSIIIGAIYSGRISHSTLFDSADSRALLSSSLKSSLKSREQREKEGSLRYVTNFKEAFKEFL